ncbi:ABC transporter substrate-binding protein [Guptibacillus hwajinpoensis]|uniref:ABC transporter substrate-binding protein n=1 Tax=Guptibacillus hwajinpoensis TaxID=208199 RepID=UPI001CD19FA5|nr:ABC transporter substrate-binding protein [Pseudalkalibacillus hwajinpoensis]MCA0991980.1 ABC transporter substrate-binding protein [Pseudalkalibacillus hwajinpoensis]
MGKKGFVGIIFLIFTLLLTACSSTNNAEKASTAETEEVVGGTVTIAFNSEPGNLNPAIWATTSDTDITHMVFDSLVVPDQELKMEGRLAESWEVSEDGKIYTFKLKDGVTWHDGEAFTADDVAFTFTSLADGAYDSGAYWRVDPLVGAAEYKEGKAKSIEGIEVVDDTTIKFTTKEPFAPFVSGLFIGILPEHVLKDVSPGEWAKHESNRSPIGTGPFKFVKWETGQYIELEANKDYFGETPKLDRLIARFGDANTMLASVLSKDVDISPVPVSETPSVESLDYASLVTQNSLSVYYVGFNTKSAHFDDPKVRQALAHAVDKESIVTSILGEYGNIADDIFPSKHWSHSPDLPIYDFDTAKSEQLLEEAGYEKNSEGIYERDGNELSFMMEVPTGTKEREKSAVLLKQMWEKIGVKVELRSLDFPTLVTKLLPKTDDGKQREVTKDDYDAYILGFGIEVDPDEYRSYFGSEYMPPNGYNFVGYSDQKVDELLEAQTTEIDFDKRQQLIWDVSQKLAEDEIWIPLYEQESPFVVNNRVNGFEPDFRGVTFSAESWSVSE